MSIFVSFLLLITGLVTLLLCGNTELEDQVHYGGEEEAEDEGELEQGEDAAAQEQAEAAADGAEEVHDGDGVELGDLRVQRLVEQLHEHGVLLRPVSGQLPQLPGAVVTLLLELSTDLREVSQCHERAPIRTFFLLSQLRDTASLSAVLRA